MAAATVAVDGDGIDIGCCFPLNNNQLAVSLKWKKENCDGLNMSELRDTHTTPEQMEKNETRDENGDGRKPERNEEERRRVFFFVLSRSLGTKNFFGKCKWTKMWRQTTQTSHKKHKQQCVLVVTYDKPATTTVEEVDGGMGRRSVESLNGNTDWRK